MRSDRSHPHSAHINPGLLPSLALLRRSIRSPCAHKSRSRSSSGPPKMIWRILGESQRGHLFGRPMIP
jgi:hypothetical protein